MTDSTRARVVGGEHDAGGLDGHVGAGADRDADVGLRERRGVVDAVADHRHPAARAPAARRPCRPCPPAAPRRTPRRCRARRRPRPRPSGVAGDHHDRRPRARAGRRRPAGTPVATASSSASAPSDLPVPTTCSTVGTTRDHAAVTRPTSAGGSRPLLAQQRRTADRDRRAVDRRLDAAPGNERKSLTAAAARTARAAARDDGPGERVLAVGLDGGGQRQQLVLARPPRSWRRR